MTDFLLYLCKSSTATAVFYLLYLLMFRRSKHFRFNRFYLLSSFLISFIIPLITIYWPTKKASTSGFHLPDALTQTSGAIAEAHRFSEQYILPGLFAAGFALFLFRFLIGNLKALSLIRKSRASRYHGFNCQVSDDDVHPFSYFNKIVVPDRIIPSPHFHVILYHEQIHVTQKHTIDVFIAEILFLFQWFNPFSWLMKAAVKTNIEFLTDDLVINQYDRQNYQMAMVAMADKEGIAPFLTALNGSQLKFRIMMMKAKQNNQKQLFRKLLILPVLTLLVLTLSNKQFEAAPLHPEPLLSSLAQSNDSTIKIVITDSIASNHQPLYLIDGKEVEAIDNIDPQEIESIEVFKDESSKRIFGDRGKNGVISIKMKKEKKKADTADEDTNIVQSKSGSNVQIRSNSKSPAARPLIILDGENKGNIDVETLALDPEDIESIDVLKEANLTAPYGKAGKNGVLLIKTKKND